MTYGLEPRYDRLRRRGMLTLQETAGKLQVTPHTVKIWLRRGLLRGHATMLPTEGSMPASASRSV